MPGVIGAIIGIITTIGGAVGGAIGAIGGFLGISTGTLVLGALGIGLSLLSSLLFRPPQPKPSDVQVIIKQPTAFRFFVLGRMKVAGLLTFAATQQGFLHRVIAMGHGLIDAVEEHWIDDTLVTLDSNGDVEGEDFEYHDVQRVHVEFRLGTDDQPWYEAIGDEFPGKWTEDHQGNGLPHAYVRLRQVAAEAFTQIFPRGAETQYRQVQRGRLVWNPLDPDSDLFNEATYSWTDNAAAHVAFLLTSPDSLGLSKSWVAAALSDWELAAAICDEDVPIAAGGTEKRYRNWGAYRMDERPADQLARTLAACDGQLVPTPGRGLALKVGRWEPPTVTLDADAIIAIQEASRGRDLLATANTIRAQFVSPFHDYKETDADPWIDDEDVAARGEISANVEFLTVPSHSQCRRLMKATAHRANPEWTLTLTTNLRGLAAIGERFIHVVYAPFGIDDDFEIVGDIGFILADGSVLQGLTIPLASLSSAAYDWTTAEEGTPPEIPEPVDGDNSVPTPENFTVTVEQRNIGDGVVIAVAALDWDPPDDDTLTPEAQAKASTDDIWRAVAIATDASEAEYGPLQQGVSYEFRVRFRTVTGRVGDWATFGPIMVNDVDDIWGVGAGNSFGIGGGNVWGIG